MAQGRHGGNGTMRCEPRTRPLLQEILAALKAPEPPPRLEAHRDTLIAQALAGEDGVWTHAVVFTTCRPLRMPINGGIDYDLFATPRQARQKMQAGQSASFRDPELWERGPGGWHPAP